jgi:hypothetical protein
MQTRKKFREWIPRQYASTPITPADILPPDDLVFFLIDLVPQLDLAPIYAYYDRETRGAPPFDVAMMTSNKGFDYCYNGQAVVDETRQIIVAADVTSAANDKQQAAPLGRQTKGNLQTAGIVPPATEDGIEAVPSEEATAKERMSYKLRTPSGRARYAKRKHIVEPVFGQIKQARGFRQFLLRGLDKVRGEWKLVCLTHNLLKIWRYQTAPA